MVREHSRNFEYLLLLGCDELKYWNGSNLVAVPVISIALKLWSEIACRRPAFWESFLPWNQRLTTHGCLGLMVYSFEKVIAGDVLGIEVNVLFESAGVRFTGMDQSCLVSWDGFSRQCMGHFMKEGHPMAPIRRFRGAGSEFLCP